MKNTKTIIYLIVITLLLILVCIYNHYLIVPSVIFLTGILIYTISNNKKREAELSEHIRDLTLSVDTAAKSTLINSPFPLVIIETNGNIVWKSSRFIREFKDVDINQTLVNIGKELKMEIENNSLNTSKYELEDIIRKQIRIGEKTYKILGEYVKVKNKHISEENQKQKEGEHKHRRRDKHVDENNYMATLYFIDETQNLALAKEYMDSKTCVGIIMIDNYEEITQKLSTEEKPQIIAKVEKIIYDWAEEFNGLIIKSDRDSFVLIIEEKYLHSIEEDKFKILDKAKEITVPGKMQTTLSIAISLDGETNYEKYKSATGTIDLALGRGGDQAIIKENGKFTFFGGRTKEVEKMTKVKARTVSHALDELMEDVQNVVIMGHKNADIDAIGAAFGVYRLAKSVGKPAFIVCKPEGLSIEPFIESAKQEEEYQGIIINEVEAKELVSNLTLLVVVDTSRKNYVEVPELIDQTNKIVVIDHHRKNIDSIEEPSLMFHEVYASSACELVTELIEYSENEPELTKLETEGLYGGIMMDTKNFTFKTGVRTFEAAAFLRKNGVDIIKVKKWFQSDLDTYNKIAKIVENTEIINKTIGISTYEEEDDNANLICAKAADELLTISDITASFVLGYQDDKVYISGRSIGDINVQLILEKMGGGGHITLAGAQVEDMTIDEAKEELIDRINEYFGETVE